MKMTRISIPVSVDERDALLVNAEENLRHPRDQARHLLRLALGLVVTTASEAAVAESPGAHPGQLGADCAPCAGYACPGRGRARRDGCELAG